MDAEGRHLFTPHQGVVTSTVNGEGEKTRPAVALTDQHLVGFDRNQGQDSVAGQLKPVIQ